MDVCESVNVKSSRHSIALEDLFVTQCYMTVCESVNIKSNNHSIALEDLKVTTPEGR